MTVPPARILAGMMAFSAACLVFSFVWQEQADRLKQVSQTLVPIQGLMNDAAAFAASAVREEPALDALTRDRLEGQLLVLAEEVRTLRQRNAELARLRSPGYIPPRLGRLFSAKVVARDSLAMRNVLTIDRGQSGGAMRGQWATSAVYLDRGSKDGLKPDLNVFTVESLVGQLTSVGPYMSQVKLLTDPTMRVSVQIARLVGRDQAVELVPGSFLLEGAGADGMVIRQVDYRLIDGDQGQIRTGDLVILLETSDIPREAASLRRVGRIVSIEPDEKAQSQEVRMLRVAPLVDLSSLQNVYVFDPTPVE